MTEGTNSNRAIAAILVAVAFLFHPTTRRHHEMSDDEARKWERLDRETDRAFEAFQIYRDMRAVERSLQNVADDLGHNTKRHIERWSSENDWQDRVRAYDQWQDRRRQEQRQQAIDEAYERLADNLDEIMRVAINRAVNDGDVRMLKDLLDRGGLKPIEQQEIQIGSEDAAEDKLADLLPDIGVDGREAEDDEGDG